MWFVGTVAIFEMQPDRSMVTLPMDEKPHSAVVWDDDKRAVRTMDCATPAWLRGQQGTASVECEVMDEFQTLGFTENVDAGDDV